MKTIILEIVLSSDANLRNAINHVPSPCRSFLILLVIACFAFSPQTQAADGDLGGGNTNEGFNALNSLTTGGVNTGPWWYLQWQLTEGLFKNARRAGSPGLHHGDS